MAEHDKFADRVELYVLGALNAPERLEFETHLALCEVCTAEVRAFLPLIGDLADLAMPAEPSIAVRQRLLGHIRAPAGFVSQTEAPAGPVRATAPWLAFAASVVLAIALGGYTAHLHGRMSTLETRLRDATIRAELGEGRVAGALRTAFEAQSAAAILAAPDLARIDLAGQPVAQSAAARAFWSRSRGLVLTASNLPAPPPGRTYQLWVLTAQPAPISAGLLKPDANGRVYVTFDTPPDLPQPDAMAVTLEREGGAPSPTGDKYLVGLAN